jgi:hypothetical protein
MGTSHPESRPWAVKKILSVNPSFILDVGAGSGTYADALHASGYSNTIDAVEVWGNSIQKYHLKKKYRHVFNDDIRNFKNFDYDVVIFGDILEHMSKEDAIEVWEKTAAQADYALIAIPIIHYHQGEIDGNPYEQHVKDDWSHEEVLETFPGIISSWTGDVVGAYWAKF